MAWGTVGEVGREASPWPARVFAAAVALVVCAPVLGPGFVLLRDMVFVPRQDLDLDALGLGGALPRAVPVDAAMALVTAVVPGDLVQKAVLVGTVFAAVLGAARLVPPGPDGRRGLGGVVAGTVYGWSPYLAERLLLGHWTLLLAWAALPWIARAAVRWQAGVPGALPRLALVCAPAALTPTGVLLAVGVVAAVVRGRRLLPPAGILLLQALPWVVAGALHPGGGLSDAAGVAAFAARAESWGGALVAVLGTGGVWNAGAAPPSRATAVASLVTLALVALAAAGWWRSPARRGAGAGLIVLGATGLALALAGTLPVLRDLLEAVVTSVPGGGLLRDGQKWAAWWALPLAVGAGLGARRVVAAARRVGAAAAVVVSGVLVLLPVAGLPDLAWGVAGRLQPVAHPEDWQRVRAVLAEDDAPGDVLVLPVGAYRAFDWNERRPQLDPAARWSPRPVVADDRLVVGGLVVDGEDPRARAVAAVADDPDALARLGVGWVLVEHGTPGAEVPGAIRALPVAVVGEDLELYRVPGAVEPPGPSPVRVTAVVLAHAGALGTVGGAVLWIMAAGSTVSLRRSP